MRNPRWAVFLSGRGSNAEALWELLAELDVAVCVGSKRKSLGLKRAQKLGIENWILDAKPDWQELTKKLKSHQVDRIFLLGFMKIVPAGFVQDWAGRIWNLHPSLLPEFPGLAAIENSYEAGGRMGVTIHEVTAEMDAGPVCLQKKICDRSKDELSWEDAQMRISQAEQRLVREWALRKNRGLDTWTSQHK